MGLGTRISDGCTSHIIIGRFSPRSIVATLIFTLCAMGVEALKHHIPFITDGAVLGQWYCAIVQVITFGILILANINVLIYIMVHRE